MREHILIMSMIIVILFNKMSYRGSRKLLLFPTVSLSHFGHTSCKNSQIYTQFNAFKRKQKSPINLLTQHITQFNQVQQYQGVEAHNPKVVSSSLTPATIVYITRTVTVLVIFYCLKFGCDNALK